MEKSLIIGVVAFIVIGSIVFYIGKLTGER